MIVHLDFRKDYSTDKSNSSKTIKIDVSSLDPETKSHYDTLWSEKIQEFIKLEINGRSLIDHFKINKQSNLWFYIRFMVFYGFRETFYELKEVQNIFNDYEKVLVSSNRLTKDIFEDNNKIEVLENTKTKKQKNRFLFSINVLKFFLIFFYRALNSKMFFLHQKKTTHFLHGHNKAINKVFLAQNKEKEIDIIWGILKEKYPNDFQTIEELDLVKQLSQKKISLNKSYFKKSRTNSINSEFIFLKSILNIKSIKNNYSSYKAIKQLNKTIYNIELGEENKIIKNIILKNNTFLLYNAFKHNAYANFFNLFPRESSINLYSENDASGKLIVDAGKINKLSTYAIQHGIINQYNYAYKLSKFEQNKNTLADKTFVWGEKYKQVLIEHCNYKPSDIFVSGQIRTDIIAAIKNTNTKKQEKTITFFSQPQPYINDRFKETEMLFLAMKEFPDVKLIVKLHPREIDDIFTSLINKYKLNNIIIDNTSDIYSLINETDFSITCYSTVGIEILYFDKILVTLDIKQKDLTSFTKNDLSYTATKKEDLIDLIQKFYIKKLNRKSSVKKYIQNVSMIDGNCSERIHKEVIK